MTARIVRITGALAEVTPLDDASLYELVRVGERNLLGEVIRFAGDVATIQIFEETTGLALDERVQRTGTSLTAELGPGLLGLTLDGVGRPFDSVAAEAGDFLEPGAAARTLDGTRLWSFAAVREAGEQIGPGDVLGTVEERSGFVHRIMVPPGVDGTITEIQSGDFNIDTPIARLSDGTPLTLAHRWPVRKPRPVTTRGSGTRPFITGQRIFDFLFPVAEGGTVAVPGGFGTGKTVIEQSLAKFAEADIVVYIACGERGNEAAEALTEFRELIDPRTGSPVMDRAVLVVNTSNMPVAARDSSVFYGMTVAEYYRDMGYRVAVMADSLSRWAEALREVATRLQEMPGEEGYPTYLASRLGKLYERAGAVTPTGKPERTGAITFIGAISPPGGEFSEPVTQASLRVVGGLWALDAALAHRRQFPAVNWEESYSLYSDGLAKWFADEIAEDWMDLRRETLELLERDAELQEIAGLVGPEALEDKDRLVMEVARLVRETILGQSAFDPNDAFSPPKKTHRLAALVHDIHAACRAALDRGADFDHLDLGTARRALVTLRSAPSTEFDNQAAQLDALITTIGEMET